MALDSSPPLSRTLLSDDVAPVHYDLHLDVDLEAACFVGSVAVQVDVRRATSAVELYALELDLSAEDVSFSPLSGDSPPLQCASLSSDAARDGLTVLRFGEPLPQGPGVLRIARFGGRMNDNLEGFYRSQYVHSSGAKRYMGVTQFEATDARRAFPCWDEPALKATFSIALTADADLSIISNMPEISRENLSSSSSSSNNNSNNTSRVKVSFDKTPVMSTYLLAWLVGEFSSVASKSSGGTAVTVLAPFGQAEEGLSLIHI